MGNAIQVGNDGNIVFNVDVFNNLDINQKIGELEIARNESVIILGRVKNELGSAHLWERKAVARNFRDNNLTTLRRIINEIRYAAINNDLTAFYTQLDGNLSDIDKILNKYGRSCLDDVKDFAVFFGGKIKEAAVEALRLLREAATKILETIRTCANQIGNLIQPVIGWCQEKLGRIGTGMAASAVAIGRLLKFAGESIFNAIKGLAIKIGNLMKFIVDWCRNHPLTAIAILAGFVGVGAGVLLYANMAMTIGTQFVKIIDKVKATFTAINDVPGSKDVFAKVGENVIKKAGKNVIKEVGKNATTFTKKTTCVCNYPNAFSRSSCLMQCKA